MKATANEKRYGLFVEMQVRNGKAKRTQCLRSTETFVGRVTGQRWSVVLVTHTCKPPESAFNISTVSAKLRLEKNELVN